MGTSKLQQFNFDEKFDFLLDQYNENLSESGSILKDNEKVLPLIKSSEQPFSCSVEKYRAVLSSFILF